MSTTTDEAQSRTPVRKSVTVAADAARAFRVFTDDIYSWWPASHHLGKTPMTDETIEPNVGGRCYSSHEDGSESDWGRVLVWEPPHRLVIAWQVSPEWGHEPDPAKSSEVEVRFIALPDGTTRIDLEHRHIDRHGPNFAALRAGVDGEGGWGNMLKLYGERIARTA